MIKKHVKKGRKGRPKIEIDWGEFEKLCLIQCTLSEMSDWFKCSEDTIERRCREQKKMLFAEYYKKHSVGGRISLRRSQFKLATAGNPTMLIWLGKQHLGQTDKKSVEHSGPNGGPIRTAAELTDAELMKIANGDNKH